MDQSRAQDSQQHGWTWERHQSSQPGRASSRPRSSSERRRKKNKGKGKDGKGADAPKEGQQTAKSQYSLPTAPLPWIGEGDNTAALSSGSAMPNPHSEVLQALKKMFPDPSQMPTELRSAVEKTEAQNSKQMTRDLHSATSQLGKAKRALAEAKEARTQHRKAWYAYLTECAATWQEQQRNFEEQEHLLRVQEEKSRLEIIQVTGLIQQLTNKNAVESGLPQSTPPAELAEVDDAAEEKKLREQTHKALSACLATVKKEEEVIQLDSDNEDQSRKRPRSAEPGSGPGSLQQMSDAIPNK